MNLGNLDLSILRHGSFYIAPMSHKHISKVCKIERDSFSTPWSEQAFINELTNPIAHLYVCQRDKSVVGYLDVHVIAGEGQIQNIAVDEKYRRMGIANLLFSALDMLITHHNLNFLTLEVRKSNSAAIAMYEKYGFTQVGIRPGYYRHPTEDAVLYTKEIGSDNI